MPSMKAQWCVSEREREGERERERAREGEREREREREGGGGEGGGGEGGRGGERGGGGESVDLGARCIKKKKTRLTYQSVSLYISFCCYLTIHVSCSIHLILK